MRCFRYEIISTAMPLLVSVVAARSTSAENQTGAAAELMEPTRHGVRLTPAMARAMGRLWAERASGQDASLTNSQRAQLGEAFARRMMRLGHVNGRRLQGFLECVLETVVVTDGKFPRDKAEPFAKQSGPLIPVFRAFLEGIEADARGILGPDQMAHLEDALRGHRGQLDKFEARVRRWAAEGAAEGEHPFEDRREVIPGSETENQKRRSRVLRNAERSADWNLRQIGPEGWSRFLTNAKHVFQFDEAQSAKGKELLAKFRKEAEAIMTDAWKERVRRNRMKYYLRWTLKDLAQGPWVYHLEREFKEMTRPIEQLELKFCDVVIGLATDKQREAALARVRKVGREHGITIKEADASLRGLLRT